MYITKTNNGHKYAATYVRIYDDDTVELVSYTTTVIEITPDGWLSCNGPYSMTTIKHIGWFMRERGFTYQLAKQLYLNNKEFNVYTGECRDRAKPRFLFHSILGVKHLNLFLDFYIIYDIMILSSERGTRKEIETMYLFYADRSGWIPMGNDGQMTVPKNIKSRRGLMKLAVNFMGKRTGRVYLMTSWTQQMSELGPRAFEEYIARNGEVLISC